MSTKLGKATKDVKKYLLYAGGLALVIIIISWISGAMDPPKPVPIDGTNTDYPTEDKLLNEIPRPEITSLRIAENSPALVARTSGDFPELPSVVNVYQIKAEREYAGEASAARETAQLLNFSKEESKVINNVMYWETPDRNRYLQYDKAQRLWNYRYNTYPASSEALLEKSSDYLPIASTFINALRIKTENLGSSLGRAEFINIGSTGYINNTSEQNNAVKVQLFKSIIAIEPINTQITIPISQIRKYKYTDGIINMIINGKGKTIKDNLLQLNYKNLSYGDSGTYEVIKPIDAFVKIQGKQGYLYRIALDGENEYEVNTDITVEQFRLNIADTKIIYIEPDNVNPNIPWTNFLQPFYLFEGTFQTTSGQSGKCAFIVPALKEANYK